MEPIKATLCTECEHCPEVEITDQSVTIGEDGNTVRLSHAEWNELVRLVKAARYARSEDWETLPPIFSVTRKTYSEIIRHAGERGRHPGLTSLGRMALTLPRRSNSVHDGARFTTFSSAGPGRMAQ